MAIGRRLPQTNVTRNNALRTAKQKNDSIAVGSQFLTADTKSRLNTVQPAYQTAMLAIPPLEAVYHNAVVAKGVQKDKLEAYVKSFYDQVFNGVKMGKLVKGDKAYFGLDLDKDVYPPLSTENDLTNAALGIVSGEAARVLAGGTALPYPTAEEVDDIKDAFVTAQTDTSTKKDTLDSAQEAVDTLTPEANGVIRKVWDEVEARYNEETPESKRENAREWGVVYVNTDTKTTFKGKAVDSVTHEALTKGTASLPEDPEAEVATLDSEGNFTLKGVAEGNTVVRVEAEGHITKEVLLPDVVPGTVNQMGDVNMMAG